MPRIRSIKPDFFKDEDLATLPFEYRMLFEGLWCWADRSGRLEYRPKYLKAEIFPYDAVDIEKGIASLETPNIKDRPEKKFISTYTFKDKKYIEIHEFKKHQNPHKTEKESVLPALNVSLTVKQPLNNGELTVIDDKMENLTDLAIPVKEPLDNGYITPSSCLLVIGHGVGEGSETAHAPKGSIEKFKEVCRVVWANREFITTEAARAGVGIGEIFNEIENFVFFRIKESPKKSLKGITVETVEADLKLWFKNDIAFTRKVKYDG